MIYLAGSRIRAAGSGHAIDFESGCDVPGAPHGKHAVGHVMAAPKLF
jgi:hypothetical protein